MFGIAKFPHLRSSVCVHLVKRRSLLLCLLCLVFLLAISFPLFFHRLGDRDLWSSHEGRAAQDAQSILNDDCWGLPRLFDRHLELQKPPLYYWVVAIVARLRSGSVDAFAVRLPAAFSALAGAVILFGFGVCRRRVVAGAVAAVVLATALHYTWLGRTGRIDMPLALVVAIILGAFYLGRIEQASGRRVSAFALFLAGYVAVAVALLLKGPIGAMLPLVVIGAWLAVEGVLLRDMGFRRWRRLAREFGVWWGLLLVVGLAAPWYVWAAIQTHGSFVSTFFWHHNIERALGGSEGLRARPWWFYAPRLAVDFAPWSPVLLGAGYFFFRHRRWTADPEARFGLVWLTVMVFLLSCAGFKRADYLLPAYPGAALVVGCAAERWARNRFRSGAVIAGTGLVGVACAAGWWVYVERVLPLQELSREHQRFASEIRQRAPAPQLVLFFRAEAHALTFHVGNPVDTFLEWENLDVWAGRPGPYYIVMPPECAAEWPRHVKSGALQEVLRNYDLPGAENHEHPLVLLRTQPGQVALSDQTPRDD
jgi:4-amino-4-deoxy-L-arabinose transferase-like glycosyltransferase